MTEDQPFEGMPDPVTPTKITFVGVRAESAADVFQMGDTHEFKVTGRVVHLGPKEAADGTIHQLVQVKVDSIVPLSYSEPASTPPVVGPDDGTDESELVT